MKEDLIKEVGNKLDELNVYIYDEKKKKEGKANYLRVVIDAEDMIYVERVVKATKIIDPIIEKMNLIEGEYILDVYAKSKESV